MINNWILPGSSRPFALGYVMQMTLRYPRGGGATAPIMQRNEGESPEGIGGMTSNPWTGNSREGRDSNAKVPCIGRGVYIFSGNVHKQE